jgi:AAA+ ATPase superfamily predicted ATPase
MDLPLRPSGLFDREGEWRDLASFVADPAAGLRIGVVYGRRRMGKSFLLEALADATGGLYHQALEDERAPALARLGASIAAARGLSGMSISLPDWPTALRALAETSTSRAGQMVVLDEFPYLLARAPELASAIQELHDASRQREAASLRLVLCGSAMSIMSRLLSGQQALRGRVTTELVVGPFDFRAAAAFWGVAARPRLAFVLFAVLGGTPGYRDLLGAGPDSEDELGAWLAEGILNPSHALFREPDFVLAEEPAITDRAIYQSALAAIAGGRRTSGSIAAALGRPETSMTHVLDGLERAGFIERAADVLRARRPTIRILDPLLRFHHAVVRPDARRFEARRTADAWRDAGSRFATGVIGPSFEEIARAWTWAHASEATLGGRPTHVGSTVITDPAGRSQLELDVVAIDRAAPGADGPRVLLIGEAKASTSARGIGDLRRLERARDLLRGRADVAGTRLAIVGLGGFDRELRAEERRRDDVVLVDIDRLYQGS